MDRALKDKVSAWIADLQAEEVEQQRRLQDIQRARKTLEALLSQPESATTDDKYALNGLTGLQASSEQGAYHHAEQNLNTAGFPGNMTRRQALWQIIPEFNGEPFEAGDLRKKLVEKYPGANKPNLPQSISNLLKDMVKRGELKDLGKRGSKQTDPLIYQENRDRGDSFALE